MVIFKRNPVENFFQFAQRLLLHFIPFALCIFSFYVLLLISLFVIQWTSAKHHTVGQLAPSCVKEKTK